MSFMLGNLSVEDMERRAGVTFPDALKEFMADRHQPEASNVKPGKWHCFDLPFQLVCGDIETATAIYEMLKPLGSKMAEPLQIGVQS